MKIHLSPRSADFRPPAILLAAILTTAMATAQDIPAMPAEGKYASLWNNSPFTSKPVIVAPEAAPEVNPLEDYALIGITPVTGGHVVTLINRTNTEKRIMLDSRWPERNKDFKVVGVNRKAGDPLGTTVTISTGRITGTVAFEEELLTITPPQAARAPQPNAQQPGAPGQPAQLNNPVRAPRPRVVAPPTTSPGQPQGRPQTIPGRPQTGGSGSSGRFDRNSRIRR